MDTRTEGKGSERQTRGAHWSSGRRLATWLNWGGGVSKYNCGHTSIEPDDCGLSWSVERKVCILQSSKMVFPNLGGGAKDVSTISKSINRHSLSEIIKGYFTRCMYFASIVVFMTLVYAGSTCRGRSNEKSLGRTGLKPRSHRARRVEITLKVDGKTQIDASLRVSKSSVSVAALARRAFPAGRKK